MPFDFKKYNEKCAGLSAEELQREWQHYTRLITGAATSTSISGLAIPLTAGVSTIGVALSAPAIHNARKKREIVERHLNRLNTTHVTRKRDVIGGVAVSGTINVVTMGIGTAGADAIASQGVEHGIGAVVANETAIKLVSHVAMDGVGLATEHAHTSRLRKREARKAFEAAGTFQAVQDAKMAEAGFAPEGYAQPGYGQASAPYNPQSWSGASSSQQTLPPPPPYTASMSAAMYGNGGNTQSYDYKPPVPPAYNAHTSYDPSQVPMEKGQPAYSPAPVQPNTTGQWSQGYTQNVQQPPTQAAPGVCGGPLAAGDSFNMSAVAGALPGGDSLSPNIHQGYATQPAYSGTPVMQPVAVTPAPSQIYYAPPPTIIQPGPPIESPPVIQSLASVQPNVVEESVSIVRPTSVIPPTSVVKSISAVQPISVYQPTSVVESVSVVQPITVVQPAETVQPQIDFVAELPAESSYSPLPTRPSSALPPTPPSMSQTETHVPTQPPVVPKKQPLEQPQPMRAISTEAGEQGVQRAEYLVSPVQSSVSTLHSMAPSPAISDADSMRRQSYQLPSTPNPALQTQAAQARRMSAMPSTMYFPPPPTAAESSNAGSYYPAPPSRPASVAYSQVSTDTGTYTAYSMTPSSTGSTAATSMYSPSVQVTPMYSPAVQSCTEPKYGAVPVPRAYQQQHAQHPPQHMPPTPVSTMSPPAGQETYGASYFPPASYQQPIQEKVQAQYGAYGASYGNAPYTPMATPGSMRQ